MYTIEPKKRADIGMNSDSPSLKTIVSDSTGTASAKSVPRRVSYLSYLLLQLYALSKFRFLSH